jgi:hypothetical protein
MGPFSASSGGQLDQERRRHRRRRRPAAMDRLDLRSHGVLGAGAA